MNHHFKTTQDTFRYVTICEYSSWNPPQQYFKFKVDTTSKPVLSSCSYLHSLLETAWWEKKVEQLFLIKIHKILWISTTETWGSFRGNAFIHIRGVYQVAFVIYNLWCKLISVLKIPPHEYTHTHTHTFLVSNRRCATFLVEIIKLQYVAYFL